MTTETIENVPATEKEQVIEIIGKNLWTAIEFLGVTAERRFLESGVERPFEVWALTQKELDKMDDQSWSDEWGWWRTGGCIFEGATTTEYKVNGHTMSGYTSQVIYGAEDGEEEWFEDEFASFTDFMYGAMNLSTNYNIALFAHSLARDNNMPLSEFMTKYQTPKEGAA